jgi:hypothetical protein
MSNELPRHFDPWSLVVIGLTLVLFLAALYIKGLTHELLLEAGVFLVSVKLILMGYKNHVAARLADERLRRIESLLQGNRQDGVPDKNPALIRPNEGAIRVGRPQKQG